MCGIFGFHSLKNNDSQTIQITKKLFELSESRGKEASGIALMQNQSITLIKSPEPASKLVQSTLFKNKIEIPIKNISILSLIGHSRLVTNGYENNPKNNQPVFKNDLTLIHNGIIVNYQEIRNQFNLNNIESELDTEVLSDLIAYYQLKGLQLTQAILKAYQSIKGMASIAVFSQNKEELNLATNNGSLYFCWSTDKQSFVFASERHILNILIDDLKLQEFKKENCANLLPNHFLKLNLKTNEFQLGNFKEEVKDFDLPTIQITSEELQYTLPHKKYINNSLNHEEENVPEQLLKEVERRTLKINNLKRCTKCVLPETFPYITFDHKGVCNYCNNHVSKPKLGIEKFTEIVAPYRSITKQKHDCLIPFSGGRDSSYVLHYVKKEMGLNPIAFSYDWGMLTDLGRRNQSRMCAELGVEHILISADIRKKRKNIQQNVSAWLKRPSLGTIPLFMAGDKQYFYYNNLIKKQNNIDLSIMGENPLEKTGFKVLFSGAKLSENGLMSRHMNFGNKLKMLQFYGKEFLLNPAYLNSSLIDSTKAFFSYYGIPHNFENIFDYIDWDEQTVNDAIINLYDWETDPETTTTWRIGDGTVAFYNYIYFMVAGFTENDTFRSNQIQEGKITREDAIQKIQQENKIRWNAIQWYCKTIGLEWKTAIGIINQIKSHVQ